MKQILNFINKHRYGLIMTGIGILIAVFDLTTKVATEGQYITLIDGFISIFSSHNTGAAWSILNKHTWLLIILSIIFIGIILFANYKFKRKNMLYAFGMGLVFGGAICNLFDRVVLGYVRDFISLDFINFPIFNIADCAITIGVCLIVLFFIILTVKDTKEKKEIEISGALVSEKTKENTEEKTKEKTKEINNFTSEKNENLDGENINVKTENTTQNMDDTLGDKRGRKS